MIDGYSFEDWMHYGKRGKREYSCFRFYSVGLNRGMPLVILDVVKKMGFGLDYQLHPNTSHIHPYMCG